MGDRVLSLNGRVEPKEMANVLRAEENAIVITSTGAVVLQKKY